MSAVRKVSKEQIIDAAVEVLRDDGFSAINARSVAKKLGCSTQPIYFSFKNMDELKAALTQCAIELHTQRDSLRAHEGSDNLDDPCPAGLYRLVGLGPRSYSVLGAQECNSACIRTCGLLFCGGAGRLG